MSTPVYDLIAIGSGPAGEQAALSAAKLGKRVAVIERYTQPGGACIHTGTIPSKTLRETAVYLSGLRKRSLYGLNLKLKRDISIADLMYRKRIVIQNESRRTLTRLGRNNVDLIQGSAAFETPTRLRITLADGSVTHVEARKIIIATGSHPVHPPTVPFDGKVILDSDSILRLDRIPRSIIIVGGGVIGSEYGSIFAALGVSVTIIEGRDRMLRFVDHDLVDSFISYLGRRGVILHLNEKAESIGIHSGRATAELSSGKQISAEKLLFAMGRSGNLEGLDIEKAGLEATERGYLTVNEKFQTSQPDVYAVGDVIGFPSLASTSMDQGRIAALHACHAHPGKSKVRHILPYGIYTIPEMSMVGDNEETLQAAGIPYEVGTASYFETARGQINGDLEGVLKLTFHRETLELLGVHAFGARAAELVHTGQAVLAYGGSVEYFVDNVFNYPTISELYRLAAFNGLNRLRGRA